MSCAVQPNAQQERTMIDNSSSCLSISLASAAATAMQSSVLGARPDIEIDDRVESLAYESLELARVHALLAFATRK